MHLSFVLPCLNEEVTIGGCIQEIQASLSNHGELSYEVLVADNGSCDQSKEIAARLGARVVDVPTRGYGAALRGGIEAATGEHVIFADADGTYMLQDSWQLYQTALASQADMAIATRLNGCIESHAMPALHRYLGTPILTYLINRLFGGHLSDCNSGFRCVKKKAFQSWNVCASGMEFASELIVKALKAGAKIVELPSGLRNSPAKRVPHLQTWHDGMRHLLFILSERPRLFERTGLLLVWVATLLQALAFAIGPTRWFGLHIFDVHTKGILLLMALGGAQLYMFSCVLFLKGRETPSTLTQALLRMDDVVLLMVILAFMAAIIGVITTIIVFWIAHGFANLDAIHWLLAMIHFMGVPGLWIIGLLGIQVFNRTCDGRSIPAV